MKVSVIVPMYNQEKYIEKCIQSLLNQTLQEFEIIVVDDASTDHSARILNEFCKKDSRIVYIKNNAGTGAGGCRNIGLERAKGEYVIFLDSDDFFHETLLESAYTASKKDDLDMVLFQTATYDNETDEKKCMIKWNGEVQLRNVQEVFNYKNFIGILFNLFPTAPWNRMIRRSMIVENNLRFQEIRHNNDVFFACMSMLYAKRIRYISHEKPLVYYRKNIAGQLTNNRSDHLGCAYEAMKAIYDKLQEMGVWSLLQNDYVEKAFSILYDEYVKVSQTCKEKLTQQYKEGKLSEIGLSYTNVVNLCGEKHKNTERLRLLLGEEASEAPSFDDTYREDIQRNRDALKELFQKLSQSKAVIWGAGKRAELFLEQCKEWNCEISYVCDSNPVKQGTFLSNIEIVEPDKIIGEVKYVLILNSYFFKEIIQQLIEAKATQIYALDMEYFMKWRCGIKEASVYIE